MSDARRSWSMNWIDVLRSNVSYVMLMSSRPAPVACHGRSTY